MSEVLKQLQAYSRIDFNKELTEIIYENQVPIVDQVREQLKFGQTPDGKKITPKYASDDYAFKKNMQNGLAGFGTPDLYKSGALYKDLTLIVGIPNDNEYSINSELDYANYLVEKYGDNFKLSNKSTKYLRPNITKQYFKRIHDLLYNK